MKCLIVFMSRHGTTRMIVERIAAEIGKNDTTMIDLEVNKIPELDSFDTILIGGSIHFGKVQNEIRKFCILNEKELLKKRIGLFVCSIEEHETKGEFYSAFPARLRNHAIATGMFGGELLLNKMNFIEKFFSKVIYGIKKDHHQLNQAAISTFIEKIRSTPLGR